MDYGKLVEAATKQARFCVFSAPHEYASVDVVLEDYSHEGDYSNLLILELGNCSVRIDIPISPDNCKQKRLRQYNYSPHCFSQSACVSNDEPKNRL